MCRLFGFRSLVASGAHGSLLGAENALAQQSARHPDGWGVAYYVDRFPQLIRSDKTALEDGLFAELGHVISTNTLLAHVRKATVGAVAPLNCHPFQHGPWSFAHNGQIAGYAEHPEVRESLRAAIDPALVDHILGATDSEVCFYLFLSELKQLVPSLYAPGVQAEHVLTALRRTVARILVSDRPTPESPSRLTFLITDGSLLLGYRHQRELCVSTHKAQCPERDTCALFDTDRCERPASSGQVTHLVLASERIEGNGNVWREVEDGDYVMVDAEMRFLSGTLAASRTQPVAPKASTPASAFDAPH